MATDPKQTTDKILFDLKISLDTLEKDAVDQVVMMSRAARMVANLKRTHAQAKLRLELVEAQLKREIRRNPSLFAVPDGKVTEGSVNEAMVVNDRYQESAHAVIDAKYQLDQMEGIIQGLEHRKRMIETEVELWKNSYFAQPHLTAGSNVSPEQVRDIKTAMKREVRGKVKPLVRAGSN